MYVEKDKVGGIAPIGVEILFVKHSGTKRLERIAGSLFLNSFTVSLLQNINFLTAQLIRMRLLLLNSNF